MTISDLNPRFKVLASQPPAEDKDIAAIRVKFPAIPKEYIELVGEATDIELECDGKYLRIWGPKTSADMDEGYDISNRIPDSIPIADDGGGRIILYLKGKSGFGLYRVGYGDLDPEDTVWISASLDELLSKGTGIQNI